mmetsp:Transcript_3392/g.5182  ORF Transcript_3392/g.5182 Transcript_3392/m.5182 type:complete len:623 (-) Transcript_3392:409-2277(-)
MRWLIAIAAIVTFCVFSIYNNTEMSKDVVGILKNENYDIAITNNDTKLSKDVAGYIKDETHNISIANNNDEEEEECTMVQSKVLPTNITHTNDRYIPRVIHLFIPRKCLPHDVVKSVIQPWLDVPNHSVLLHDYEDISVKLKTHRYNFVRQACVVDHNALIDLARFVYLYDEGGLSFDIEYTPGPGFLNETIFDLRKQSMRYPPRVIGEADINGRFFAAEPKNFITISFLMMTVGRLHQQFSFDRAYSRPYKKVRNFFFYKKMNAARWLQAVQPKNHLRQTYTPWHFMNATNLSGGNFLDPVDPFPKQLQFVLSKACSQFLYEKEARNPPSLDLLLKLTDHYRNTTCPPELLPISNQILPNRTYDSHKLIPTMVHMTSKSKCMTPKHSDNIENWKKTGHSFFLHDDAAVQRLLDEEEWSEFPLLRHVLPCLSSGAMKADLWRYLLTWKYGGIYTDMDNAPGNYSLMEGNFSIKPEDDAFFEVEAGGFPSQYFYAASPHHPVSYFMVSRAIERMLGLIDRVFRKRLAPYVTGPGACKTGVMSSIGGRGYYNKSTYPGVANRSVTIVGSIDDATNHRFVGRSEVAGGNSMMNMSHYNNMGDKSNRALPGHNCLREAFESLETIQ